MGLKYSDVLDLLEGRPMPPLSSAWRCVDRSHSQRLRKRRYQDREVSTEPEDLASRRSHTTLDSTYPGKNNDQVIDTRSSLLPPPE